MSGVCLLLHQVCVYFRMSPHSLILVSVAVAACTCAWFRLQLAHLIFSLNPPLPSPLFPLHTFPPFFFFFPSCLSRACRESGVRNMIISTQEAMRGEESYQQQDNRVKAGLTMRCKLERCVSGMKRTGRVTWSSRVWKKVLSLPMELLTTDLLAGNKRRKAHNVRISEDCIL